MQGTLGSARASVRTWVVALLAACSMFAVPAFAQTATKVDRPDVKVGDQWEFAIGSNARAGRLELTWIVTSVTSSEIQATENGKPLLLSPDLNQVESPRRKNSDLRLLNFPLEVGKSWTYVDDYWLKDTGTKGRSKTGVTVLTFEKVRVPAGEFDAFKLESISNFIGTSIAGAHFSGESSQTYWYAPAARAIIKEEINDPYRGRYGSELVSYKLQP